MLPFLTDAQFNSLALIIIAAIGIVPATMGAIYSRKANRNSAGALHEVKANGGMSEPDPTLKDYVKYVGENVEQHGRRLTEVEESFREHLEHSRIMDAALAEVFLSIRPQLKIDDK